MQTVLLAGHTITTRQVLHSWKDIANYTGRGIRTLQRYEVQLNFPIHRPAGKKRSSVLAFSDEVDAWFSKAPTASTVPDIVQPAVTAKPLLKTTEWSGVAANAKRSRECAQTAYEMCMLQAQRVREMTEKIRAARSRMHSRPIIGQIGGGSAANDIPG